jgi:hypothetical protein
MIPSIRQLSSGRATSSIRPNSTRLVTSTIAPCGMHLGA